MMTEREKIAHLLRRFGMGASESELEYYGKNGLSGAIDLLLDYDKVEDVCAMDPQAFANKQGTVNIRVIQGLEMMRLLCTQRPLEEKMTLFWHNHFGVARAKVEQAFTMYNHMSTLRLNAIGKFGTLLREVSEDPAMLYYLDNQLNVKAKPNENFAREVMELFTLGIGHYTEKDIQEAARAFTGWRYGTGNRTNEGSPRRRDRFMFVADQHDETNKTIFGKTGNFNGGDVLAMLCANPQTARYIAKKAWDWFAYENADSKVISRIADKFFSSGLDIRVLVRAIMESPEFYSEKSVRRIVKNPIDFAVVTARQLGAGAFVTQRLKDGLANPDVDPNVGVNRSLIRALGPCYALLQTSTSQGMELLNPPDVSGWRTGNYWITSATMVERAKWADRLFAGGPAVEARNLGGNVGGNRGPQVGYNPWPLFADDPSPAGVVKSLLSVFDVTLPESKRQKLEEAVEGSITQQTASATARRLGKLIFSSPEFQFA
jgi:uncharacterized protein (DUF1800 family)